MILPALAAKVESSRLSARRESSRYGTYSNRSEVVELVAVAVAHVVNSWDRMVVDVDGTVMDAE